MEIRRPSLPAFIAGVLLLSIAAAGPAQTVKVDKKVQKAVEEEQQAILTIVSQIETGTVAPADYPMTLAAHFYKAGDQQTWIPLTIAFPTKQASENGYTVYLQATRVGAAAPGTGNPDTAGSTVLDADSPSAARSAETLRNGPMPVVQQIYHPEMAPATGTLRVSRGISLPPGEYDLLALVRDRSWSHDPKKNQKKQDVVLRAGMLRQRISVPDYWADGLTTSTILLADKVETVAQNLSADALVKRPYVFGTDEWVPAADMTFGQSESLSCYFQVYNPVVGEDKRPDVSIDYNFYVKPAAEGAAATERYFNKTDPVVFNSMTLPPTFDGTVHVLPGAQQIPLASFQMGEYRLEITVTDKLGQQSVTRNVVFTVR